nr:MAG TPA: hypothetical protein [Caudoviricetes sp.]
MGKIRLLTNSRRIFLLSRQCKVLQMFTKRAIL